MVEYQKFADRLVKDGFLLTALEFHAELQERGKTLKSLQNFFEDSTNFETFTRKLERSPAPSVSSVAGSQANCDDSSLFDITRYSEDSHQQPDDRVVLEFELRKARDTIHSLRDELTQQALQYSELLHANASSGSGRSHSTSGISNGIDGGFTTTSLKKSSSQSTMNDCNDDDDDDDEAFLGIQRHEQRTLNYLVNEYLLQHNYKLTSITFSDENLEEDFEDWDSIGLNVAKPPNLLRLFRDFKRHISPTKETCEKYSQTFPDEEAIGNKDKVSSLTKSLEEQSKISIDQKAEIKKLQSQLLEAESSVSELKARNERLEQTRSNIEIIPKIVRPSKELHPQRFCRDSVPKHFYDYFVAENYPVSESLGDLNDCCSIDDYPHNFENVIEILSKALPNIVPNVLLSKRDELIPLLLVSIQNNSDDKKRDELLHILFNLIKRPDNFQRQVILTGFKKIAENYPDRIESELMPQLWEQIGHKYAERRILIAETCNMLLPYTPGAIRNSLIYSILNQLISDDRDLQVRQAAVKALSLVLLSISIDDSEKWYFIFDLMEGLLKEPSQELVECVQLKLLPAFALWSSELNRLESNLVFNRLEDLAIHCDLLKEQSERLSLESQSKQILQVSILSKIETLSILLPFVMKSVIEAAPVSDENTENLSYLVLEKNSHLNLILSQKNYVAKLLALQEYLYREWYEAWPELQWVSQVFVPNVINCISKTSINDGEKIVLRFAAIIRQIGSYLGQGYVASSIAPSFIDSLPRLNSSPESFFEEECKNDRDAFIYSLSGLAPGFFLGCMAQNTVTCLADTLRQWSVIYCFSGFSTDILSFIIRHSFFLYPDESAQLHDFRDAVSEMAWSMVVHTSVKLRSFSGTILKLLVESTDRANDDLVATKILPGLITLSSDVEMVVRKSSIAGLSKCIMCKRLADETREKASFQIISFIDPTQLYQRPLDHDIRLEVIHELSGIVSSIKSQDAFGLKLRDEIFLIKIAELNFSLGAGPSDDSKSQSLLELTTAMMACYKTIVGATTSSTDEDLPRLPLQTVQVRIVPSLQKLASDLKKLSPGQELNALQLIGHLEAAYGRTFVLHLQPVSSVISSNDTVTTLSTGPLLTPSPSMDEMRQRVGKIFQKPGQAFWKKS